MSIVAISETLGSLGDEVGRELAHTIGYEFADREIISQAAERFGGSPLAVAHAIEERPTLWERFRDTQGRYLASVEAILLEMAARDGIVLVGRGATLLLAQARHAIRVRISAPETVRAQRVQQRHGLTAEAGREWVRESDRELGGRIKFLYHVDWDDPRLYDLVLNTERVSASAAVRILREALDESFATSDESRQHVSDLAAVAQAKAGLLADPLTSRLAIDVTCRNGQAAVSGLVDDEEQRRRVLQTVGEVSGVTAVANEVVLRPRRSFPAGV